MSVCLFDLLVFVHQSDVIGAILFLIPVGADRDSHGRR